MGVAIQRDRSQEMWPPPDARRSWRSVERLESPKRPPSPQKQFRASLFLCVLYASVTVINLLASSLWIARMWAGYTLVAGLQAIRFWRKARRANFDISSVFD